MMCLSMRISMCVKAELQSKDKIGFMCFLLLVIYKSSIRGISPPACPGKHFGDVFCLEGFLRFDLFLETRIMILSEELPELSGLRS